MRLVYLDEAGTTSTATSLAVAGVIVHGDDQWPKVDRRIVELIEKYIPEEDRLGFVFHATDLSVAAAVGVLANDTDADGDALTAILWSGTSHELGRAPELQHRYLGV